MRREGSGGKEMGGDGGGEVKTKNEYFLSFEKKKTKPPLVEYISAQKNEWVKR